MGDDLNKQIQKSKRLQSAYQDIQDFPFVAKVIGDLRVIAEMGGMEGTHSARMIRCAADMLEAFAERQKLIESDAKSFNVIGPASISEIDEAARLEYVRRIREFPRASREPYDEFVSGAKFGAAWAKSQAEAEIADLKRALERQSRVMDRMHDQLDAKYEEIAAEKARSAKLVEALKVVTARHETHGGDARKHGVSLGLYQVCKEALAVYEGSEP